MTRGLGTHRKVGLGSLILALLFASALGNAATPPPATIKDIDKGEVDVKSDAPQGIDAAKTMDSYKRFLDLNAGDAELRAEALRRLADLHLESS